MEYFTIFYNSFFLIYILISLPDVHSFIYTGMCTHWAGTPGACHNKAKAKKFDDQGNPSSYYKLCEDHYNIRRASQKANKQECKDSVSNMYIYVYSVFL